MPVEAKTVTQSVAGAAIFGALSFVLAAVTAPYLPRMPGWGIAFIDPVSIIWIVCFLIFGLYTGLLCSIIGTVGLLFFDPFTPIGPIMKLLATLPIILALNYGLRLYGEGGGSGSSLKQLRIYVPLSVLGTAIRIVIMIVANILLFLYLFNVANVQFTIGTLTLSAWNAVIAVAILINVEQSIWDCGIPYILVFTTRLKEHFKFW
jgi:riboflavin transporter FmnP